MSHIHHVPGRLRIRIPELKRNPAMADSLKTKLESTSGVRSVIANSLTGSVLIHYDCRVCDLDSIFQVVPRQPHVEPRSRAVPPRFEASIANAIVWYAVEKAVERSIPFVFSALF